MASKYDLGDRVRVLGTTEKTHEPTSVHGKYLTLYKPPENDLEPFPGVVVGRRNFREGYTELDSELGDFNELLYATSKFTPTKTHQLYLVTCGLWRKHVLCSEEQLESLPQD